MTSSIFVVTGTSRGIGLELVRQLASKGHLVFACARNPDASEKLQKLAENENVIVIKMDNMDRESIKSAAKEIEKKAPEGIDVLFNNAAINGQYQSTTENVTREAMLNTFETNVCAVSDVNQAFLPLLCKRGKDKIKKIINTTSTFSSLTLIDQLPGKGGFVDYCVSKTALNMLTKITAIHLAKENFIVYAACPGWVKTDMGGEDALLTVEKSVANQIAKMEEVTLKDSGKFFGNNGDIVPW